MGRKARNKLQYFVEGECEKCFIKTFIHANKSKYKLSPGKVEVFNVACERLTQAKARSIDNETRVVLVFDTDMKNLDIFEENIDVLRRYAGLEMSDILLVMSIRNFEEEIVSASDLKTKNKLINLFSAKGIDDMKSKFISVTNLEAKLLGVNFDLFKM